MEIHGTALMMCPWYTMKNWWPIGTKNKGLGLESSRPLLRARGGGGKGEKWGRDSLKKQEKAKK